MRLPGSPAPLPRAACVHDSNVNWTVNCRRRLQLALRGVCRGKFNHRSTGNLCHWPFNINKIKFGGRRPRTWLKKAGQQVSFPFQLNETQLTSRKLWPSKLNFSCLSLSFLSTKWLAWSSEPESCSLRAT